MKKILSTLAFFLLLYSVSFGQGIHFGFKAGSDLHKISGVSFTNRFNFGYHLGGLIEIKLNEKWSLQPEVYYSETRLESSTSLSSIYNEVDASNIRLSYINIPMLLNLKLAKQFAIQFGPQYGILSNKGLSLRSNAESAIKSGDFSAIAGMQIHLPKIRIYARYQIGLNNINEFSDQENWQTQNIHLGVGFLLF